MSILIKDATVIAMDGGQGAEARQADIRVQGDRIAEIGPDLDGNGTRSSTPPAAWRFPASSTPISIPTKTSSAAATRAGRWSR